ncbi:MAG: hypothetical protein IIY82_06560, partial [Firmicutes bacterium]|nr:hypothetical protein [Bacillota bacterium]
MRMTTRKERFLRAVRSNTQLKVGFAMLLLLILVALLAGVIAPYDPYKLSDDLVTAPSATHLLGTDHLGRDVDIAEIKQVLRAFVALVLLLKLCVGVAEAVALFLHFLPVQPRDPGSVGRGLLAAIPFLCHGLRRDAPKIVDPDPAALAHIGAQLLPEDGRGIPVQILLHGLQGIHDLFPAAGKILDSYGVPVFDTPGPGVEPDVVIGPQAEELEQEHGFDAVHTVGLRHVREGLLQVPIPHIPVLLNEFPAHRGILPQPAEAVRAGE